MKVTGELTESYQVKLSVNEFEYIADRIQEKGGENTGTSPHGLLLSSIASCKLMVAKGFLDHNKISYDQVDITAESEIQGAPRHETIDIHVVLKVVGANLDDKQIKNMTIIVDNGCTMANILTAGSKNKVTATVQNK